VTHLVKLSGCVEVHDDILVLSVEVVRIRLSRVCAILGCCHLNVETLSEESEVWGDLKDDLVGVETLPEVTLELRYNNQIREILVSQHIVAARLCELR
jgi:hypothetical protein